MNCELEYKIFDSQEHHFDALALEVFHFQYTHSPVYRQFVNTLGIEASEIIQANQVPFMPVQFFKTQEITAGSFEPEAIFESSGTTNTGNSRHPVKSLALYRQSFLHAFHMFYGDPVNWTIVGLLPSYLERQNSSLVFMVDELIRKSKQDDSGFYLHDTGKLVSLIEKNEQTGRPTLLIGVTFALLDLAENFKRPLRHTVVMETGGMKGRRKELTRSETHELLKEAWGIGQVHSEYGMTELLSQAYSSGEGLFRCPPWMKIAVREEDDPLSVSDNRKRAGQPFVNGIVNVTDLANIYSCSFIATDDIGKLYADGSFEIMGRVDSSDIRGCNLMYVN